MPASRRSDTSPATSGMKADGYYDLHSEYQRRVIEQGMDLLRQAVQSAALNDDSDAFTIADYGASTGSTSVAAMQTAIMTLRKENEAIPVCAVHNDVLTNDFTQLFHNITAPHGYLDTEGGPIFPTAVGGSFFGQVMPSGSVNVGMCSNAAHWCSQQPRVNVPAGIYLSEAHGKARDQLARQAHNDWCAFLSARASELKSGGYLLKQGIGRVESDTDEKISGAKLLRVMGLVAAEMSDEGLLNGEILEQYTFPVYCRNEVEIVSPMEHGGALADQLKVVSVRVDEVTNPYWEKFQIDNDIDAYTDAFMEFIHAWADATMMTNLFEPGAKTGNAEQVAVQFFDRLASAIRENPAASVYDAWVIRVLCKRL